MKRSFAWSVPHSLRRTQSRLSARRLASELLPPLMVAFASAYWLSVAAKVALKMPLGGDHGIFQYLAWAMRQGDRMYADYREVNGPGAALIHMAVQVLVGETDAALRRVDLGVSALVFFFAGAMLPGLGGGARRAEAAIPASMFARAGWGSLALAVLMSGYLHFDFWSSAQRESFLLWFLLPSAVLQMNAMGRFRCEDTATFLRRQRIQLVAAAALSSLTVWIKPTFVVFPLVQGVVLLAVGPCGARKRSVVWFALSCVACGVMAALLLLAVADLSEWARCLSEGRSVYRFMWNKPLAQLWDDDFVGAQGVHAAVLAGVGIPLVAQGAFPRRMLLPALLPLAAVVEVTFQHKGFVYHYIPVVLLVRFGWVAFALSVVDMLGRKVLNPRLATVARLLPMAALAFHTASTASASPLLKLWMINDPSRGDYDLGSAAYYRHFKSRNTPFLEQTKAADYLRRHTLPHERIQVYGRDPWVLFKAKRLSATAFAYPTDLNVGPALRGSGEVIPDTAKRRDIRELAAAHDRELLTRLEAHPPAKFVFIDARGLLSMPNAPRDFFGKVPRSGAWVSEHYQKEKTFGPIHIYGKKPLAQSKKS